MDTVQTYHPSLLPLPAGPTPGLLRWYAVQTRAKHEKKIGAELPRRGITALVPTVRQTRNWSDRRKVIEAPLFPCYAFVQMVGTAVARNVVRQTPGVLDFVRFGGEPASIPDAQIESIQAVLNNNLPYSSCGFLKIGQRVRVRGGALDNVEGILTGHKGERKLIITVDLIQQSMAVLVEGYDLEPV
jgi:transcription antitermination factor NusG